jgi:hypothetical protein
MQNATIFKLLYCSHAGGMLKKHLFNRKSTTAASRKKSRRVYLLLFNFCFAVLAVLVARKVS